MLIAALQRLVESQQDIIDSLQERIEDLEKQRPAHQFGWNPSWWQQAPIVYGPTFADRAADLVGTWQPADLVADVPNPEKDPEGVDTSQSGPDIGSHCQGQLF